MRDMRISDLYGTDLASGSCAAILRILIPRTLSIMISSMFLSDQNARWDRCLIGQSLANRKTFSNQQTNHHTLFSDLLVLLITSVSWARAVQHLHVPHLAHGYLHRSLNEFIARGFIVVRIVPDNSPLHAVSMYVACQALRPPFNTPQRERNAESVLP